MSHPSPIAERLELELRLSPRRLLQDALQEAQLALIEDRDPARAFNTFVRRERRREIRETRIPETRNPNQ